jgi:Delta3-Delta2-enoyl-CoA isomerase
MPGIGVTLLPHMDLVICTEESSFWTPFARLSLVPEFCSSVTFPALMGSSLATEMLLLGKKLSAQQALSIGLVSQIHPAAQLMTAVRRVIAEQLLCLPQPAASVTAYKRVMSGSHRQQLEQAMHIEFVELDKRLQNGDALMALTELRKQQKRVSKL